MKKENNIRERKRPSRVLFFSTGHYHLGAFAAFFDKKQVFFARHFRIRRKKSIMIVLSGACDISLLLKKD